MMTNPALREEWMRDVKTMADRCVQSSKKEINLEPIIGLIVAYPGSLV